MSQTYSDVDASSDPTDAVAWQERVSSWPAVRAYKERTHELLAGRGPVVDVGCGPGVDVIAIGDDCVGVDSSETMVAVAAGRGAAVCRANAHALPFRDASLHGARGDRVLQHLADPTRALSEMARVVMHGGALVVADPDQESLVIEVPGVRQSVLDRLKALRRDVGYRNGRIVSRVPALLDAVGVEFVGVDAFVLSLDHPDDAFGLPKWPHHWRTEGAFTDGELQEWDEAISNASSSGFIYLVTFLVVHGAKQ